MTLTQKEYKRHIKEVEGATMDVAKSPQGKCFLRWLINEECEFLKPIFPRDEKITIWKEAKRDVAVKIVKILQAAGIYDIINDNQTETLKASDEETE